MDNIQPSQSATVGMGCKLVIKLDEASAEPRPLGDSIVFYSSSKTNKDSAFQQADIARMGYSIGKFDDLFFLPFA